jgi:hypothetical protein
VPDSPVSIGVTVSQQSCHASFIKVATKMSQKRKAGKSAVAEIGACQSGFPGRAAKNALGSGFS